MFWSRLQLKGVVTIKRETLPLNNLQLHSFIYHCSVTVWQGSDWNICPFMCKLGRWEIWLWLSFSLDINTVNISVLSYMRLSTEKFHQNKKPRSVFPGSWNICQKVWALIDLVVFSTVICWKSVFRPDTVQTRDPLLLSLHFHLKNSVMLILLPAFLWISKTQTDYQTKARESERKRDRD